MSAVGEVEFVLRQTSWQMNLAIGVTSLFDKIVYLPTHALIQHQQGYQDDVMRIASDPKRHGKN